MEKFGEVMLKLEDVEKIIVILGPTATGKTDLAVKLAKKFAGEIVSADSRQIFKGMDIATAKPKIKNGRFKGVPHYLIDSFPLNKDLNAHLNVAIYKNLAIKAIKDIQKKGKLAFLVGGTGLYIKAVIDNLDFPKAVPNKVLRRELESKSPGKLFQLYRKLDPKGAKVIDKDNKRRLIRAIEVCLITEQPFWQQRSQKKPLFNALQIGIKIPKTTLNKTIARRTNKMLKLGLEKEAKKLFKKYGASSILSQTIGYLEWLSHQENKIEPRLRRQVIKEINNHSCQYAKRQMTWFKKDQRIIWLSKQNCFKKASKLISQFIL